MDRDAHSIDEFCDRIGISKSFYFVIKRRGQGPREMHVGNRVLISREASADWRRAREAAAQAEREQATASDS